VPIEKGLGGGEKKKGAGINVLREEGAREESYGVFGGGKKSRKGLTHLQGCDTQEPLRKRRGEEKKVASKKRHLFPASDIALTKQREDFRLIQQGEGQASQPREASRMTGRDPSVQCWK